MIAVKPPRYLGGFIYTSQNSLKLLTISFDLLYNKHIKIRIGYNVSLKVEFKYEMYIY